MLKQAVLRGGAHSGPMLLRCGRLQPFSAMARNFSQTAAALQEPAGDAAADKVLNREERLSKMENFVRKHWKEGGSLPTPYVLMKEFGGARTTANKVLSRIEEELKAAQPEVGSSSSPENSQKPNAIIDEEATIKPVAVTETRASNFLTDSQGFASDGTKAAVSTDGTKATVSTDGTKAAVSTDGFITPKVPVASRTSTFEAKSASITTKISPNGASMQVGKEQGKSDGKTDLKATAEPGVSLWKRLHNIAYGNPSSPTPSPATKPTTGMASRVMKPTKDLLSSSEDDSESDSASDGDMTFPEPDGDKNPAQPLFRSDLQQRHGLYIKFLSPQATESDVRGAFRSCGDIHRVQVVRGRNPSAKYIYAFVDFTTEESLKVALKKEVVIRGSKVLTETANRAAREKPQKQQESDSDGEAADPLKSKANLVPTTPVQKTNTSKAAASQDATSESGLSRCTIAIENIPQSSLPQIVEALSQYGDIASSRTKISPGGNTTAFVEFKNECDKDNALSASKVLLAGKTLKMTRLDSPLTTVVRLSNIPPDARDKVASSYKSYGQVDKVDTRMEGVLDIYYSGSELKNMARILDKLNCLHMSKKKLRAIPAPISYPKSLAETAESPVGLKWIESQRELVTKNLESSLKKAAMYSQDLQELLKLQSQIPDLQGKSVAASN